jgi:6-pyruvoyltetrahydropterin/6-carboxytetrahydropterin synthase
MEIYLSFHFDAAHKLPNVPKGHKCGRLHGHTYNVHIYISGPVDTEFGWVMDFRDIKKTAGPVIEHLDHNYLNEIEGLENPTTENIARWLWARLKPKLPTLTKIIVQETPANAAIYQGE